MLSTYLASYTAFLRLLYLTGPVLLTMFSLTIFLLAPVLGSLKFGNLVHCSYSTADA